MIFENFRSSQKSRPSRLVPPDVPLASSHHEETTMAAVSALVAKHKIVNEFIFKNLARRFYTLCYDESSCALASNHLVPNYSKYFCLGNSLVVLATTVAISVGSCPFSAAIESVEYSSADYQRGYHRIRNRHGVAFCRGCQSEERTPSWAGCCPRSVEIGRHKRE